MNVVSKRLLARIAASPHQITVNYPPKRVAAPGVAPGTAPASPLTGTGVVHTVVEVDPTPSKAPVTMQCLWVDATQVSDLRRSPFSADGYGWMTEADAVARVTAVASDEGKALVGTDFVAHDDRRFTVLAVIPVSGSFYAAATYNVWLKGSLR